MEGSLQATVTYAVDAKRLWDDLKERYSEGNQSRVFQIKTEICLLKQDGPSVRDYYGKLKLLWDELEFYLEHPGCRCGVGAVIAAQRETEKCFQFLMGLTSDFGTIRSTILSIEPMSNLNKVYKMVANEKRQKLVSRARESAPESAAFLSKENLEQGRGGTNRELQGFSGEKTICSNCGKVGHMRNSCWALIGYPSWHPKSKPNGGKGSGQGQTKQSLGREGEPNSSEAQTGQMQSRRAKEVAHGLNV
ncbi:hypothetical protein CRG98_027713 [Punica granatum]|uniref:CCHC-type domain-containing protein n=1 Tax=Punica granatum TaxID=22663 RepID=A0A2I0J7L3_PUNGR|nr:hypothetical protein CRG98_027713 [Punica granatum]